MSTRFFVALCATATVHAGSIPPQLLQAVTGNILTLSNLSEFTVAFPGFITIQNWEQNDQLRITPLFTLLPQPTIFLENFAGDLVVQPHFSIENLNRSPAMVDAVISGSAMVTTGATMPLSSNGSSVMTLGSTSNWVIASQDQATANNWSLGELIMVINSAPLSSFDAILLNAYRMQYVQANAAEVA